ncbi:MAG: hypothetical protein LBE13_03560 [Bacteroidales bacterium]|jgi:hypothetical protein|nr:hypothetical protein [Bacteroidales bacterium]
MKRIIRLVVLLKGQNGMKTMKRFLIASMVLVTVSFATINVVVNDKAPIVSNVTLKNLEAFTDETYDGGELPTLVITLFHGVYYNNIDTHSWGTKWCPELLTCSVTEQVSYGAPPIVYTLGTTFPGHYISCKTGNGNCYTGTDCIKD